ncbi:hypothetical protein HDU76_013343 [Blyttiomyces sp. JEL0837]|nr:hypothetical protein HDU76_013343 [Blyttiomyces sp. JEL0837]
MADTTPTTDVKTSVPSTNDKDKTTTSNNPFTQIKNFSLKYGPAWLIVIQALGWITFSILYGGFLFFPEPMLYVRNVIKNMGFLNSGGSNTADSADSADLGTGLGQGVEVFAVAFALNRFLSPLRILVALYIVPKVADPINGFVRPLWRRIMGGGDDDGDVKQD